MSEPKLRRKAHRTSTRATSSPSKYRKKKTQRANLHLLIALFWPVLLYIYLGDIDSSNVQRIKELNLAVKQRVSMLLSRKDLVGYGPRYPRLVVLVTGEDWKGLTEAVQSVFENTDRNRILSVIAVVDGMAETSALKEEFESIDNGETPHWHGMRYEESNKKTAENGKNAIDEEEQNEHGKKIHVIFNKEKQGAAQCRQIGAMLAKDLADKHEKAQLKLKEEELILMLMRQDTRISNSEWLDPLTAALIVPELAHKIYKTNLANAVSFYPETHFKIYDGKLDLALDRYSYMVPTFDLGLEPSHDKAFTSEIEAHPTPALHGACTAMRLNTFLSLPARDTTLTSYYAADIELALNLWLCADGIDVLPETKITEDPKTMLLKSDRELTDKMSSRIAAAWMDDVFLENFYDEKALRSEDAEKTKQKMMQYVKEARKSPTFPIDLQTRCRKFSWYVERFLPDSNPFKQQSDRVIPIKIGDAETNIEPETPNENVSKPKKKNIFKVSTRKMEFEALTPDKLDIINRADPIDLQYVDASNDPSHYKALDENGKEGYVYDPTSLRRNPPQFQFDKKKMCKSNDAIYKMLTEKVRVDMESHLVREGQSTKRVKLFCTVYTIEKNHDKLPMVRETWGQKCDGFIVASDKTDPLLNTVAIPHEGPEAYENIWQKNRAIWAYVYDNFYNDYDWFHIGGDDLYLIVENLRLYLESDEIQLAAKGGKIDGVPEGSEIPLFLGRRFAEQGNKDRIFNSGGSGYTLNKAALKLLVVKAFPNCFVHLKTFAEDVMVAHCLRDHGVFPYETKDKFGGERYMPFDPGHHLTYRLPADINKDWYAKYSLDIKEGLDHCSADSVAFHYIGTKLMARMHSILYHFCD